MGSLVLDFKHIYIWSPEILKTFFSLFIRIWEQSPKTTKLAFFHFAHVLYTCASGSFQKKNFFKILCVWEKGFIKYGSGFYFLLLVKYFLYEYHALRNRSFKFLMVLSLITSTNLFDDIARHFPFWPYLTHDQKIRFYYMFTQISPAL